MSDLGVMFFTEMLEEHETSTRITYLIFIFVSTYSVPVVIIVGMVESNISSASH